MGLVSSFRKWFPWTGRGWQPWGIALYLLVVQRPWGPGGSAWGRICLASRTALGRNGPQISFVWCIPFFFFFFFKEFPSFKTQKIYWITFCVETSQQGSNNLLPLNEAWVLTCSLWLSFSTWEMTHGGLYFLFPRFLPSSLRCHSPFPQSPLAIWPPWLPWSLYLLPLSEILSLTTVLIIGAAHSENHLSSLLTNYFLQQLSIPKHYACTY